METPLKEDNKKIEDMKTLKKHGCKNTAEEITPKIEKVESSKTGKEDEGVTKL